MITILYCNENGLVLAKFNSSGRLHGIFFPQADSVTPFCV